MLGLLPIPLPINQIGASQTVRKRAVSIIILLPVAAAGLVLMVGGTPVRTLVVMRALARPAGLRNFECFGHLGQIFRGLSICATTGAFGESSKVRWACSRLFGGQS